MFEAPSYEAGAVVFAALGATLTYGKMSSAKVRAWALSTLIDKFFGDHKNHWMRFAVELAVFVTLGVLIGVGITQPTTPMQALTAGLGWTALAAKHGK